MPNLGKRLDKTGALGKFEDFIIAFIGRNSHGEPSRVTYQGNEYAAFVNRVLGSSNNGGPAGYQNVTTNQTIVVYFTTEVAVTVCYVEHLNMANVLKITVYGITEQFRLLDDTSVILMPDNQVSIPHGGDYERGSTPRAKIAYNGKTYIYVGYSINGGTPVMGEADAAPITNVTAEGNVITYLYKQKAIFLHIRQVVSTR